MLLMCPQCQAKAQAKCDCGVGYVPAGDLARMALIKTPHKSDRAIAKELGISVPTVSRARSTVSNVTVEKRIGRDGRRRSLPRRKSPQIPNGRKGPGISVPHDERYPGLYRLQTAWMMASQEEGQMFLEWVKEQQERKPCDVVNLQRTAAQGR